MLQGSPCRSFFKIGNLKGLSELLAVNGDNLPISQH